MALAPLRLAFQLQAAGEAVLAAVPMDRTAVVAVAPGKLSPAHSSGEQAFRVRGTMVDQVLVAALAAAVQEPLAPPSAQEALMALAELEFHQASAEVA